MPPSSLSIDVGRLIVAGFSGEEPSPSLRASLADGRLGGVILFRRNLRSLAQVQRLCESLRRASIHGASLIIGIDEEGGRVRRLPPPALHLPPMRELAALERSELLFRVGAQMGLQLRHLGINLNFAPVLDVVTHPGNSIIGDRAFGVEATKVIPAALAYVRGLQQAGVAACGKHFPGHGATLADSHFELPRYEGSRSLLDLQHLPPFRAAVEAGIASLMTAHIVYPCIDSANPATLSHRICTEILRGELGFRGVLFSDDLEMKAISGARAIEAAAVDAVSAGCDALLVCSDEGAETRVFESLFAHASSDAGFATRCREGAARMGTLGTSFACAQPEEATFESISRANDALTHELDQLLARPHAPQR